MFSGHKIEEFQVEVLGVLENLGPKQSIILARLSAPALNATGVMQGMSGSPVYIDGKLVGAVALAFPFSKEPIAGIRPIEEMMAINDQRGRIEPVKVSAATPITRMREAMSAPFSANGLTEIATPISFAGFSSGTLEHFAPQLRELGLSPVQGVSSGGHLPSKLGNAASLEPGEMITVQLLSGDISIGADGTLTSVDGNRVYAFGHKFLSVGDTDLPFARADVITLMPNLQSSFKISSAREWMGSITQDRSTCIFGEVGREASSVPLNIAVDDQKRPAFSYHAKMVNDRVLSPLIVQMAVFSALDATERTVGMGSFVVHGTVQFQQNVPALRLDNTYAGDLNVPQQVSSGIAAPLAYAMSTGFDGLKVKSVDISVTASEKKRALQIDQVTASPREVRPGDTIELGVTLSGENGSEVVKTARYRLPVGIPAGPLMFTVGDATSSNAFEYSQIQSTSPKSAQQVISFLNGLRPNNSAYVRIWRSDPAYQVQGADLPDPPPSVALLLGRAQAAQQGSPVAHGSTLGEMVIDSGDAVVAGTKTIQVDVKE